jgi:hypothetical protein
MKPKLILCLALVLSGGLLGCYDIANADETIGTNQWTGADLIDVLKENGAKLGCYFTIEHQDIMLKASLHQMLVTTNLNADSIPAFVSNLRKYMDGFQLPVTTNLSADSIPAFVSNLRNYLDGFVVVEDARNPRILHIIDKVLADDPDYPLNKRISLKYSGGLAPNLDTGNKLSFVSIGGLIPALAPKAGRIMSASEDSSTSAFDYSHPLPQISVDATNETVRSIMSDCLPLGDKPVLWRATNTKMTSGELWVWVQFF